MVGVFVRYVKDMIAKKRLNNLYKLFHRQAIIGDHFATETCAIIWNESQDKSNIVIGSNCRLAGKILSTAKGKVHVGNYTTIQSGASIRCVNTIQIGSFTGIAENVVVTDNNTHPTDIESWITHRIRVSPSGPGYPGFGFGWELSQSAPVIIGNGVWIGGDSTILKGVTIGDGAIVARASVVTKDVEPFSIVAGNPAKKVKQRPVPEVPVMELAKRILAQSR